MQQTIQSTYVLFSYGMCIYETTMLNKRQDSGKQMKRKTKKRGKWVGTKERRTGENSAHLINTAITFASESCTTCVFSEAGPLIVPGTSGWWRLQRWRRRRRRRRRRRLIKPTKDVSTKLEIVSLAIKFLRERGLGHCVTVLFPRMGRVVLPT